MRNTAIAQIDLSGIRHNLGVVRGLSPDSRIMAMVKADAYGHGLVQVAGALSDADAFAVARLDEALSLRASGIAKRVLLLGTLVDADDLSLCSEKDIDVTAHDAESLSAIKEACRTHSLRVWLKLDSGMHRLGLEPAAFLAADRDLKGLRGVRELTHMTHFSDSENLAYDKTDRQLGCFDEVRRQCGGASSSVANSAAILGRPATRREWVRPGIMLYGSNPLGMNEAGLRPAMTLKSCIIAIREIGAGEPIGYNERWIAGRPSRIATVGIGYGDGYPRHAPNATPVWLDSGIVPLVGRVSMDTIAVDVTDRPTARVGDQVVLWGGELPVAEVAACAGTISYALLTCLGRRVTRVYEPA